jgi:hypothetical protein
MKKLKIEIKWALIFVTMQLSWMLMEKLTGLHETHIDKHAFFTNGVAILAFLIYALALLDKRKNHYHGKMTYLQGFVTGIWITLIVTLLTPITQYITSYWISPEFFNNMIAFSVSQGKMSQEKAESFFNFNSYLLQSTLFAPVAGIVTSAIVAIFTRKS